MVMFDRPTARTLEHAVLLNIQSLLKAQLRSSLLLGPCLLFASGGCAAAEEARRLHLLRPPLQWAGAGWAPQFCPKGPGHGLEHPWGWPGCRWFRA